MLEDKKLTIVICSNKNKSNLKIAYNFFIYESKEESVIIYYDRKKIGQLFIDNWKELEGKIEALIKNLYNFERCRKEEGQKKQA